MPAPELICFACARTYGDGSAFCPVHPDEPLLDVNDPAVVEMMVRYDSKRRWRLRASFAFPMMVVFFFASIALYFYLDIDKRSSGSYHIITGITIGGAIVGNFIADRIYKPFFTTWTRKVMAGPLL